MIKTVLTPSERAITIDIPQEYIGKRIEVIAYASDEVNSNFEEFNLNTHFLSEAVLATDWSSKDEDEAWKNL